MNGNTAWSDVESGIWEGSDGKEIFFASIIYIGVDVVLLFLTAGQILNDYTSFLRLKIRRSLFLIELLDLS